MKDRYETIQEGKKFLEEQKTPLANQLIELMNEMSGSDRREIVNRCRVAFIHFLKFDHQPDEMSSSWLNSAIDAASELESLFEESPSLLSEIRKPDFMNKLDRAYARAIQTAANETKLNVKVFPKERPYSVDDVYKQLHPIFKWTKE